MVASADGKSKDNDKDNFAVAMAPPSKKAKTTCCIVPRKARKVVKSNDKDTALFAKLERLLADKGGDPLAI
jgi:hypothetical protein